MKKFLEVLCFAVVVLAGGARLPAANLVVKAMPDKTQTLESLAITIMQSGIKSAVNTFYGQYLNRLPEINVSDTKITDITAYNGAVFFDVTVETTPFIETNVPVGKDKISLFVDVFGSVEAEEFEHQKNINLPLNYKDRILKALPENTVVKLPERTRTCSDIKARPDNDMTKAQKLDGLVRVLVISNVQNAVNVFYAPYLSSPSMNAYFGYEIVGLTVKKDESGFTLVVTITPYVGAHNSIGREKITMDICKYGVIFVTDYEHLENYGIVPWLKGMLKKPLPEGTQNNNSFTSVKY